MIGEKPRLKLTYADYLTTPEDKRYELLDGELLMSPAPDELHQRTQAELGLQRNGLREDKGVGTCLQSHQQTSFFRMSTSCSPTCCSFPMIVWIS